ncbi:sugar transferase [Novosphingobium sp. NDB2Meth1]|uniref:sugar transferase n=1 Tax=Novosphingobium sp. NDB2Meth1 TaxID=1892847 RepID=UPI00352B9EE4
MNSLMPAQVEPWAPEAAPTAFVPAARPVPPPRVLSAVPLPPEPLLPPRRAAPASRHMRAIRVLDIAVAATALLLLLPVLLAIALAIKLLDPGPLFFAHQRLGQGGRPFRCLKFRSMTVDAGERLSRLLEADPAARAEWAETHKLRCDPRITPLGRFLRRSCLDELPQLFNVLRGEMSLVGPRPITTAEVVRYGRYFAVYCSMKPGITGLWQVKREDATSYRRRVAFDLAYARSRSLVLNCTILLLTVPSVLRGQGAC